MGFDPQRWPAISRILDRAFELPESQRERFVRSECAGDAELLAQVAALLEADRHRGSYLDRPVAERAAALIVRTQDSDLQSMTIGAFRTVRLLGYGGMGLVYLAERADGQFEQRVAIKCLRSLSATPEMEKRFRKERQILARLQHPGIAHLIDGGVTEAGHPYFAMEYVEGVPLTDYCDAGRLGLKARLGLFLKVCEAVSYAHRNMVIHRDLKPSNILVVAADPQQPDVEHDQVKLLDFGIARMIEEGGQPAGRAAARGQGGRLLTLAYATPEQLLGVPVSTATDVYTLGLLLYEMLCGVRAQDVEGLPISEASDIICGRNPPPPSAACEPAGQQAVKRAAARATTPTRLRRALRADLDHIVMRAINKGPQDRYPSAEALAEDLKRYLRTEPVEAHPPSRGYRLGKFLARYRLGLAATASILVLLATVAVVSARSNIRIRAALETARLETAKATEIAQFMQQLFETADPYTLPGEQISVGEILDRGAARIARDLSGQPQTRAGLTFELARIYNSLGLYERADELLGQALATLRELHGDSHPDVARALHWQSIVADNLGQYERSQELAEAALALRLELLPPGDPDLGESKDRLASLLAYTGEKDRALGLAHEAVAILDGAVGEEDRRTQTARHNLAWMLGIMGRYAEATAIYEQVISVSSRVSGPDHPETLETLNNFGVMLRHQGDLARAEEVLRRVLAGRLRVFGAGHPQVGFTQNNLAKLLVDRGKLEEAIPLYEASHAILEARYGPQHTNVAVSLANRAQVLFRLGRRQEAESLYRRALDIHYQHSPEGSVKIASALIGLGHLLTEQGRTEEAEPMLRDALAIQQPVLDPGHWEIAAARLRLGQLLVRRGDTDEALQYLAEAREALLTRFGDGHRLVREADEAMAMAQR